jgi:hypoxanthine-guanine phosphoribosyltransferase
VVRESDQATPSHAKMVLADVSERYAVGFGLDLIPQLKPR